jgi:hypothetical protein
MENHNWTQPANQFTGGIQQIFQNPNAPFINSLVDRTGTAVIDGAEVNISQQVAYATADYNWTTPSQYNDMHTTLSAGYKGLTGDPAKILQAPMA